MEIDSGSGISTMPLDDFLTIHPEHQLHENDLCLRAATGHTFKPHSYPMVNVNYADSSAQLRLYLIDQANFPRLFGRQWLRNMNMDLNQLVRQSVHQIQPTRPVDDYERCATELLSRYKNLLKEGIGCIPNTEARLELTTTDPQPIYLRARPVAHALI